MLTSTCGARPPHQTTTDAMREPPAVSLVCCDLASLVIDGSIVERAFAEAIATQGIVAGTQDYVRSMVRLDRARGRPPADVLQEIFDGRRAAGAGRVAGLRPLFPRGRGTVRHEGAAGRRRGVHQGGCVGRQGLSALRAVRRRLWRPPRRAVPPGHRGPGAVRGRRAARLPVAGPRAHRDAAARNARRPGGRDGQRHRERPAVRLAGRRQDRRGNRQRRPRPSGGCDACAGHRRPRCPT